jgi:hypothetical protein
MRAFTDLVVDKQQKRLFPRRPEMRAFTDRRVTPSARVVHSQYVTPFLNAAHSRESGNPDS